MKRLSGVKSEEYLEIFKLERTLLLKIHRMKISVILMILVILVKPAEVLICSAVSLKV